MMLAQFHKVAKGRGLVGRAAESNQPVLVADTLHNSEWLPNQLLPDTRSEVAIPISIGEQVLGVLDVQHNIVEGLRPEEIDALQAIANQVAIALQNARQVQQTVALASELASFQSAVSEAAIVATTDVSGKIEAVNEKFVQISKYSREELLGQDHRILNSGYHTKEFMRNLWVTIANGKVWRNEIRNKAKDGSFYWVDTTIAPVLNDRGKPIKYVAIRFDITQRKELEFNVAQRAASLGQLDNITQKIQSTTSIESALQIAVRELGHAFGMKPTFVTLDPGVLAGEPKQAATPNLPNETESLGTGVSQ
jgi:PAS domain S-box-containing protein